MGKLLSDDGQMESFLQAIVAGDSKCPVLVWMDEGRRGELREEWIVERGAMLDWLPSWVSLVEREFSAGKSALWEDGVVYPMDFSSVWAASALLEVGDQSQCRVLDVCAAPGGKSLLASRFLCPERLVSNEVIGKRLAILRSNLGRCGIPNAFTQRRDPSELGELAGKSFDVVLVDAPCSGQSLVARGIENPGCFHPKTIKKNALRQRRIIAESLKCVAPGSFLLYTTCTFAIEENEKVVEWLLARNAGLRAIEVAHLSAWRSEYSEFPAYRLYPDDGMGAGAFAALLQTVGDRSDRIEPSEALFEFPVASKKTKSEEGD
ncbi:MAG: RsmB/NOP family class I SAM-dependent RNA methyltransferase [Verrucomicrobiota bacterium]